MRRVKPHPIRNQIDMTDHAQVRLVMKRLRLSRSELSAIVARSGNSLAAITKEAGLQRPPRQGERKAEPAKAPAEVVIASAAVAETSAAEPVAAAEPTG